jgi:FKBP-type peptidyl-prolyl cis-trans isomerase SlyD
MTDIIEDNKYVELTYKVIDEKTGNILTLVEFPIGYIQGATDALSPAVTAELAGKSAGDTIEVPIDCNELYGPRDESLVITDYIENVPEEYRELGTKITMENDKGDTKTFLVTRKDDTTLTIDGNNPLCGRQVIFQLEIITVRDATDEELEAGGKVEPGPDLGGPLRTLH